MKKFDVTYYTKYTYRRGLKRIVKVKATLEMVTNNRGKVIECTPIWLDDYNDGYMIKEITENEIGDIKNIKSCYYVSIIE